MANRPRVPLEIGSVFVYNSAVDLRSLRYANLRGCQIVLNGPCDLTALHDINLQHTTIFINGQPYRNIRPNSPESGLVECPQLTDGPIHSDASLHHSSDQLLTAAGYTRVNADLQARTNYIQASDESSIDSIYYDAVSVDSTTPETFKRKKSTEATRSLTIARFDPETFHTKPHEIHPERQKMLKTVRAVSPPPVKKPTTRTKSNLVALPYNRLTENAPNPINLTMTTQNACTLANPAPSMFPETLDYGEPDNLPITKRRKI